MLDIRLPIGYLFLIIGAILTVYALVQPQITVLDIVGSSVPQQLRLNLDLPCGISMLVFAGVMLGMSYLDPSNSKKHPPTEASSSSMEEHK